MLIFFGKLSKGFKRKKNFFILRIKIFAFISESNDYDFRIQIP
ncbi:hypothetical protein C943_03827 [Mariniradius saccharolyticus AK6]|uniref:Uncharacterized protein n=1 Tax=Mariniradius saccharolyticus AK6 TaxID=1239962 RepID=M7YA11_9BACT|nr:hypothetical protein C943_03827 [Mariniradius saccharolyticus AK6]